MLRAWDDRRCRQVLRQPSPNSSAETPAAPRARTEPPSSAPTPRQLLQPKRPGSARQQLRRPLDRRCPLIGYVSALPASAGSMVPPGEPSGVGGPGIDTAGVGHDRGHAVRGGVGAGHAAVGRRPGRRRARAERIDPRSTLLASGITDEGIARAPGWSTRTTQRRIRALMDTIGAGTRFQLGMSARPGAGSEPHPSVARRGVVHVGLGQSGAAVRVAVRTMAAAPRASSAPMNRPITCTGADRERSRRT